MGFYRRQLAEGRIADVVAGISDYSGAEEALRGL
jgi:hypothetical protein